MDKPESPNGDGSVLVIIPGSVNYFYNQLGRRVAEAIRALGCTVDVVPLCDVADADYDLCLVSNIYEVGFGYGDEAAAAVRLAEIRKRSGCMAAMGMESVGTNWYSHIYSVCDRTGVDRILDFGLWNQTDYLLPYHRNKYQFAFNGLTPSEVRQASAEPRTTERAFPWAFVGHQTHHRAALVDYLIQAVDPGGFVYLPSLAPCAEKGSPHLNQQQYELVLAQTRYQVWCSHHAQFYVEVERFRASLLTGGVAVKVVESTANIPERAPFRELMMTAHDLPHRLTVEQFPELRRRFQAEALGFTTLVQTMAEVLPTLGIRTGGDRARPLARTGRAGRTPRHRRLLARRVADAAAPDRSALLQRRIARDRLRGERRFVGEPEPGVGPRPVSLHRVCGCG